MTAAHRSLVALTLLGAGVVHLAVAASGVAPLAAALLGVVGVAEAVGAALVLRGALAADPGLLVALVVAPVILLSGALTLADALERPDLVAAFATPALLGSAVLAFAGAAVAGLAARRLRSADAPRAEQGEGDEGAVCCGHAPCSSRRAGRLPALSERSAGGRRG